jgi:lactoylglutathione lyase
VTVKGRDGMAVSRRGCEQCWTRTRQSGAPPVLGGSPDVASTRAAAAPPAVGLPVSDKGSRASAGAYAHPTGNHDRPARRQPCHTGAIAAWPIRLKAPTVGRVKTLHTAYRVTDLAVSLDFYSALGYQEVGRISLGDGATLTVLKFPGEEVVTLELVHRPADGPVQIGTGLSHLVVQVDELAGTIAALSQRGLQPEPEQHPAGPDGPRTSWLTDPDGYRIELVQWPAGHPDGITAADFP